MRTRSGEPESVGCQLCESALDAAGTCSDRCDDRLTRIKRESITYVYVHDSVISRRPFGTGRPIGDS